MEIRFYLDPGDWQPHVHHHGITETEVAEALASPLEDGAGAEGSRVAIGRTEAGRILRVIYVPDADDDALFVITAYPLGPAAVRALRRRLKRRL